MNVASGENNAKCQCVTLLNGRIIFNHILHNYRNEYEMHANSKTINREPITTGNSRNSIKYVDII